MVASRTGYQMSASPRVQQYIYNQEQKWFKRFEPFLQGRVLKVGNGLGYLASFIEEVNPNMAILEIQGNEQASNKDKVVLYDGKVFPFEDNSFGCVVCTLVLHHTPNPLAVFKEMQRVAKRVILLEETYDTFFSKLDLVYRDIYVNARAGQPSQIHWNSYFKGGELETHFAQSGLQLVHHHKERRRSYHKELFIADGVS